MSVERHLVLQELVLQPSAEWTPKFQGWLVARVLEGSGYWMQSGSDARQLGEGDGLIIAHKNIGVLRASQLGRLKLQFFIIQPQHLNGLLTVVEWHRLEIAPKELASHISFFTAAEPISAKFARIAEQFQNNRLSMRCALLQLWAGAVGGLINMPDIETADDAGSLRARFRQLVGQMTEAELAESSLSDLAGQLHCSERHFSRLFREEFSVPLRAHQIELRLQRARQLLTNSDAKIINVAYDSGYRHLGLFNSMFKKRFGLTPSEWRRQNQGSKKNSPHPARNAIARVAIRVTACLLLMFQLILPARADSADGLSGVASALAGLKMADDARTQSNAALSGVAKPPAKPKPPQKFRVEKYMIEGNSVLTADFIGQIFTNSPGTFGTNVTFESLRAALSDLQMAYRERGFVTVSVGLPQQKLTNATVKIQITEGRLAAINITGNRYFSSNNIMRALPGLRTNMLLNSHVFQRELDTANGNRDRQIYPVIGPGPEPGTSELTLKVKDEFPLHARLEINDQGTPGTPAWRGNLSAQYDNLWDLEHQIGAQYSCSFEKFTGGDTFAESPFDDPLVANYSAYYRLPLWGVTAVQEQIDSSSGTFGYNEITHQFVMPPATGRPELTIFASRSVSDTGIQYGEPSVVVHTPIITIASQNTGENHSLNEDIGGRLSFPLPPMGNVNSAFLAGVDYKHYHQLGFNTNNFYAATFVTNSDGSVSRITTGIHSGQQPQDITLDYLPLTLGLSGSVQDGLGTTFFNVTAGLNFGALSGNSDFAKASYSTNASARYAKLQMSLDREQKIYKDWTVRLHADGQWSDTPLFSNEQYAMGGANSVRGYMDGEAYGDSGWRVTVEPRTPLYKIGYVDGTQPFWVRGLAFVDYGQLYHTDKPFPTSPGSQEFCGIGFGMTANIGQNFDARLTIAWPLKDDGVRNPNTGQPYSPTGVAHVYFGAGLQF